MNRSDVLTVAAVLGLAWWISQGSVGSPSVAGLSGSVGQVAPTPTPVFEAPVEPLPMSPFAGVEVGQANPDLIEPAGEPSPPETIDQPTGVFGQPEDVATFESVNGFDVDDLPDSVTGGSS